MARTASEARSDNPMTSWRTAWRSLRKAAGPSHVRFHDGRHTALTRLAEKGIPDWVIRTQFGHVSPAMMAVYSHGRRKALDEAPKALEPETAATLKPEPQAMSDAARSRARGDDAGESRVMSHVTSQHVPSRRKEVEFTKESGAPSRTRTCDVLLRSQPTSDADRSRSTKIGVGCAASWSFGAARGRVFPNGLQVLASSPRRRALGQEINPTHCLNAESPGELFVAGTSDHQRPERRVSLAEFEQPVQLAAGESCALDFDRPRSPTALQHAVHLERLFAPVGDALAGINGGSEAGVLDPGAKARRIPPLVGRTVRMHGGEKSIVERYELWWCRAPTDRARSELLENGNKIGVLQQLEVMSHRLERATIRKLPLDFLQRHDLRGATHGDRERLTQEGRTPHLAQGQYVAADRRVDDRVPDVRAPSCLIVFE